MGQIITFYSYKGGVGRSMALANVAMLIAQWKYRVLIVDWDLEAPGLENYFRDFVNLKTVIRQKGIIDLMTRFNQDETQRSLWQEYLVTIRHHDGYSLDLLTAGERNEKYFTHVRELDVGKFYKENKGGLLIESLRNEWKDAYDYILIDSRTGITDIGGICTIQLPDILLLFSTPTEQALDGVVKVAQKAIAARQKLPVDRLRLLAVPILSRFDTQPEFKISREWLERFVSGVSAIYADWLPKEANQHEIAELTKIPYIPYFSFGEKLPVLEQGTRDPAGLGYAYETLAALLTNNLEFIEDLLISRDHYVLKASKEVLVNEPLINEQTSSKERSSLKVLFLAANPKDTARLRLDEEVRAIQEALWRGSQNVRVELQQLWAARLPDLLQYLQRFQPDIVHLSGHGYPDGIILEDDLGQSNLVSGEELSQVFSLFKSSIRCVILNASYSENSALEISRHIDCVIGISQSISDKTAINFAATFYEALAFGKDIKTAFNAGCAHNVPEYNAMKLFTRPGVNPSNIYLVAEKKEIRMIKKPVFVSFDFDRDKVLKDFIIGQAKLSDSPFEVIDHSLKEAAPVKEWEAKARQAIKRAKMVIVMVGEYTYKAPGVLKEVQMAREEGKPIVQIIGYKDKEYTPVPNAGRIYQWNWDNLKKLLADL